MNKEKELNKRKFFLGTNSISIAVVVVGIVAIINFFGAHNQKEADFTKNKIHSFSDQSTKVLLSLKSELKAEFYGDFSSKAKFLPLFENYERLSKQFKFEHVDPYKEPARVKAAGIKKIDTLMLTYEGRTVKVEELTEEKVTNAIIKILKANKTTVCMLIGHGEASIEDITQSGMQSLRKGLEDQAYVVKEISISKNSVPAECNSILMMGVHGSFFPNEIQTLSEYFSNGGRAVVAVDAVLHQEAQSKEFHDLLNAWGIEIKNGLIVDPEARKTGVDASLVLITTYNPHQSITKYLIQPSYFPFARPVVFKTSVPAGLITESIAKTSEQAWAETDINSFIKGTAEFNVSSDTKGPLSIAVATSGKLKDSSAARDTRIVVFGSSQFVNNQYSRFGANLDFFMNAVSWVLDDESLISIRTKDEDQGRVDLPDSDGTFIFWLTVVILPFAIALFGILIWLQRKKL